MAFDSFTVIACLPAAKSLLALAVRLPTFSVALAVAGSSVVNVTRSFVATVRLLASERWTTGGVVSSAGPVFGAGPPPGGEVAPGTGATVMTVDLVDDSGPTASPLLSVTVSRTVTARAVTPVFVNVAEGVSPVWPGSG